MMSAGYWGALNIRGKAPDMKFEWFHWPMLKESERVKIMNFPDRGYYVSSKTQYKEEAMAIYEQSMSLAGQKIALKFGRIPVVKMSESELDFGDNRWLRELWGHMQTHELETYQCESVMPSELALQHMQDLQGVFDLVLPPEQAVERMVARVDEMKKTAN